MRDAAPLRADAVQLDRGRGPLFCKVINSMSNADRDAAQASPLVACECHTNSQGCFDFCASA